MRLFAVVNSRLSREELSEIVASNRIGVEVAATLTIEFSDLAPGEFDADPQRISAIWHRVREEVARIDGLSRLHYVRRGCLVSFVNLQYQDQQGRKSWMPITATGKGSIELYARGKGIGAPDLSSEALPLPATELLDIPEILPLLDAWGITEPHTWFSLYKIWELLGSNNGPISAGRPSPSWLRRFTQSANHQLASGVAARHATMLGKPQTAPLALDEAETELLKWSNAWIAEVRRRTCTSNTQEP